MDQDEPKSFSNGQNPEGNPQPVATNPDTRACETSSLDPGSGAARLGIREARDGSSPSTPGPGLPANLDRARRADRASERHFPDRIAEVRRELFGDEGIPAIADALHLPHRTWTNYEQGVVMPATVLLLFLDLTMVESHWLLTGRGPRYQGPRARFKRPNGDEA